MNLSRVTKKPRAIAGAAVLLAMLAGLAPAPASAQRQAEPVMRGIGPAADSSATRWSGWLQFDTAYAWPSPAHLTNFRTRGELAGRGEWSNGIKWRLSGRAGYDAVYDLTNHYPSRVARDQRFDLDLHEAYIDFNAGDWEFRLGKQNIVWGEMVGLFFADVVSAKDMREFVLPEFDQIRIPQWAARAEWFFGDSHLEFIWLPTPAVDRIGVPGAEFYPWPLQYNGYGLEIQGDRKPSRRLSNSGIGLRLSTLVAGWDMAAFVYRAPDTQAAFHRSIADGAAPRVVYQPRHDRVTRIGGTLAKDFDGIVAKAELVYTQGRRFGLTELDAGNGLVELKTLDWVVGADLTPIERWRFNLQFYQRAFLDYDRRIGLKRHENGASLLVSHALNESMDAEMLGISSLNRKDWLLRAMLIWKYGAHSRVRFGIDVFDGEPFGLFGRFDRSDRIWAEYRYSF